MVVCLRYRWIGGRVCSLLGAIERQRLWSGWTIEAGYRLLPARCIVVVGIIVRVVVSAINVWPVC